MRNPLKRLDVFRCVHPAHAPFEHRVSAYHVLENKGCFPGGCVYFKWHCRRFEKGQTCPRGYRHTGRLCFGCKYFDDEKVSNHAEAVLEGEDLAAFHEELEQFDDWVQENEGRETLAEGQIAGVKPRFELNITGSQKSTRLRGFVLIFARGFLGTDSLEDRWYAHLSQGQQERLALKAGDEVEFAGTFRVDRGRVVLHKLRRINVLNRSDSPQPAWDRSRALVARHTSTVLPEQLPKCLACPQGALMDVTEHLDGLQHHRRRLVCLEGLPDPLFCLVFQEVEDEMGECQM